MLDLSCPVRFSGLANNAKLEMVRSETPRVSAGELKYHRCNSIQLVMFAFADQQNSLMIQVEDGRRIPGSFLSSTSLWNVLEQLNLLPSSPESVPELVYMRQKVCVTCIASM